MTVNLAAPLADLAASRPDAPALVLPLVRRLLGW